LYFLYLYYRHKLVSWFSGGQKFLFLSNPLKPILSSLIVSFQIKQSTRKVIQSSPLFFTYQTPKSLMASKIVKVGPSFLSVVWYLWELVTASFLSSFFFTCKTREFHFEIIYEFTLVTIMLVSHFLIVITNWLNPVLIPLFHLVELKLNYSHNLSCKNITLYIYI
jgi:hypothetical protein